jgi:hypothetical protein
MRTTFLPMLIAAILATCLSGTPATAQEYYDGACDSCDDGGCYGDCYGDCGCYGDGGYCRGHGLFRGHHGGPHKGPCYWCGGCCLKGGACCCYNCGSCDCGYMLPVRRAQWYNWNRNYAYTDFGSPTALVVPPTASLQTNYGWGVASSRISRIDHQFQRNYPGGVFGGGSFGGPYRPTPVWPSDTTQFGVYYVRGPW